MKEEHMEAQHDTDGGHDRAALRTARKKGFHKAAAAYFKLLSRDPATTGDEWTAAMRAWKNAMDAYKAWKNAH